MQVNESEARVVFEADGVVGKFLSKTEHCECIKLEIQGKKRLEKHLVPFAATFYVISGSGKYLEATSEAQIVKGSLIHALANTERGFENTDTGLLEILVVKHPQ